MRRIKPHDFRSRPAGAIITIRVRDYRLMRAVVRAAERQVKLSLGTTSLIEALDAFNAPEKRK